jgi:predicted HNH restriction endonuclease
VCHIKPISSFEETVYLSVINSQDNLVLLCPNCHWEFDNGHLEL